MIGPCNILYLKPLGIIHPILVSNILILDRPVFPLDERLKLGVIGGHNNKVKNNINSESQIAPQSLIRRNQTKEKIGLKNQAK